MRVLLVGGSGFIGRSTAAHLLRSEYGVGIYSRNCSSEPSGCAFHCRDLSFDQELGALLNNYQAVIYLVTSTSPRSSMDNPHLVYGKDIPMFLHLMECCREAGIRRVIYASSGGTVYGTGTEAVQENENLWARCHYGIGKITCEKILSLYNQLYHMENIALRIANPYGMDQVHKTGDGAVTTFAKHIIREEPITLYGDGRTVRDFVEVSYIAEAFRLALEWKFDSSVSPVFNVGSGIGLELKQVIAILSGAIGKVADLQYLPANPWDVPYNCLDIKKIQTCMGYIPPADPRGDIASYAVRLMDILNF